MSITRILLAAALGLAFAPSAFASSSANPTGDWDEAYVGPIFGEGFGDSNKINGDGSGTRVGNFHVEGIFGGAEAGFNQHWGNFMFGLELDAAGSGVTGNHTCVTATYQCYTEQHWVTTFRPRVGYTIGPVMPFITAGLAYGDVTSYRNSTSLGITNDSNQSNGEAGIAFGGGAEYMIGREWSVKAQYLYVHYSDQHVYNTAGTAFSVIPLHTSTLEGALNYRFN